MKLPNSISLLADPKSRRLCFFSLFPGVFLLCLVFFIRNAVIAPDFTEKSSKWEMADNVKYSKYSNCKNPCRPDGSEALPNGIVSNTSNLEMRPLWGAPKAKLYENNEHVLHGQKNIKSSVNLLAVAVGIKQKNLVNKMVKKFLSSDFVVMLFHYDGIVDEWKEFDWSNLVIHVSAVNQTKWWFAKRFLHPDIVAEYNYVFLWDEDLGVENFNPERYISIVKSEGLEISQPALDSSKSEVHHQITARGRRSHVHRRIFKPGPNGKGCDQYSKAPPCTGWIEMMATVFSRAAWRCVWYMIQNDLIHAWGLDMQLGYCAQGDRTKNVGVVDAEYIVHYGLPTLGGGNENKINSTVQGHLYKTENLTSTETSESSEFQTNDHRIEVRRQSYAELRIFKERWKEAVKHDKCWIDPYAAPR